MSSLITRDDLVALRGLGRAREASLNATGENLTVTEAVALAHLDELLAQDTSYRPAARIEHGELVLPAVMGEPYFDAAERYTAALIVSYDADDADGPADAANLALGLVMDGGCGGTVWKVVDHVTGEVSRFEQGEVMDDRYGSSVMDRIRSEARAWRAVDDALVRNGSGGASAADVVAVALDEARRICIEDEGDQAGEGARDAGEVLADSDRVRAEGAERVRPALMHDAASLTARDQRLADLERGADVDRERARLVEGIVTGLMERVDGIASSVEIQSQSLSIEDGRVRALRGEVDGFAGRLAGLDERVGGVERLSDLLTVLERRVDGLTINAASNEQVQDLRATVQDLARKVADLERLSRLRGPR